MLTVAPVTSGLPEGADQGFRLMDGDQIVMFFHWANDPDHGQVAYASVLAALPDRLTGMGYEDQVPRILGTVVDQFGAGA